MFRVLLNWGNDAVNAIPNQLECFSSYTQITSQVANPSEAMNCKWSETNEPLDPWVSTRWLAGKRLLPFLATCGGSSKLAPTFHV